MQIKITSSGSPGICRGLCPSLQAPDTLVPVELPAPLISGGWKPVATIDSRDGGYRIIVAKDRIIGLVSRGIVTSQLTLPSAPRAFHSMGRRVEIVADTDRYTAILTEAGTLTVSAAHRPLAAVGIRAVAAPTVAVTLGAHRLKWQYQASDDILDSDRRNLHIYMRTAYSNLYRQSIAAGRFIQPVVARLQFKTADGKVAFCSEPVLLVHPEGKDFDPTIDFSSDDGTTLLGRTIEQPSYRIAVDLVADSAMSHITSADLVVSPQLSNINPFDDDIGIVIRPRSKPDTLISARFHDGIDSTLGGPAGNIAVQRLAAALDQGKGRVIATIGQPFTDDRTVSVAEPVAAYVNAAVDFQALEKVLTADLPVRSASLTLLTPPHLCLPDIVETSAGAVLLGGLRSRRFDGCDLRSLAATVLDKPWQGYLQVTFTDGTTLVRHSSGADRAPATFAPMLSYPSPDVHSITIGLQVDGDSPRAGTYYPDCDPSRSRSVYVAPGRRPFILPVADAYTPPDRAAALCDFPDHIAAAAYDTPFDISAIALHGFGRLHRFLPARFGQSSWDFGRVRFYALGSSGIFSVSLNADRSAISVSLLDSRQADSPHCAVETPLGVMALVGHDIVCISGSRVKTFDRRGDARALIWDSRRHELWLLSPGADCVEVLCPGRDNGRYALPLALDPDRLLVTADGIWPASADTVYDISNRSCALATDICWQGMLPAVARCSCMGRLELGMSGRSVSLHVSLRRRWMRDDEPGASLIYSVDGPVTAPLAANLRLLPGAGMIALTLQGSVSPDFNISYADLRQL
ncbi:MAG: hypothetical protein Q4C34_01525 [Bacteroidales bacterium]|nr:hypothetical protein [Bacteroidales bacterium]